MVGQNFVVRENGVEQNYVVAQAVTFDKVSDYTLSVDGVEYSMTALATGAWGHDLILVTCAGVSLGGGDATQRLILFADAV